ncbi:MAG: hypothetical protein SFW67_32040 [Myxococcaceae bacterium]|nr:hypothetical protein [Myxococcaceae bacterium]
MKPGAPNSVLELFLRLPNMIARESSPVTLFVIGGVFALGGLILVLGAGPGLTTIVLWGTGVFAIVKGIQRVHTPPPVDPFRHLRLDGAPLPIALCFQCRRLLEFSTERCPFCSNGGECFQVATEVDRRLAQTRLRSEEER